MSTPARPNFERFEDQNITDRMLEEAATLFSENYGVWGPLAEEKLGVFARKGKRVCMSINMLKSQCVSACSDTRNIYVCVKIEGRLVGNVLASQWNCNGENICWISQLVVESSFRRQGLATKLLLHLHEGETDGGIGILSSHPAAISAALRAFGQGLDNVDLRMTEKHARSILQSAPISYVRNATLRGSLFEEDGRADGTVSLGYTNFWVDHQEPFEALTEIRKKRGMSWPFGELLEGHEYLVVIDAKTSKGP